MIKRSDFNKLVTIGAEALAFKLVESGIRCFGIVDNKLIVGCKGFISNANPLSAQLDLHPRAVQAFYGDAEEFYKAERAFEKECASREEVCYE